MLEEGQKEGVFRAVPSGAGLSRAQTGNMQVGVMLNVMDADGVVGEQITWYGSLSEKAREFTFRSLRTMGWKGDDISDLSMLTNEVSIVVAREEYNGKTYEKVKFINAPGGSGIRNQLDESEAKAFAASLKSTVRAFDAKEGKPKTTGAPTPKSRAGALPPEPPPITEDDSLPNF